MICAKLSANCLQSIWNIISPSIWYYFALYAVLPKYNLAANYKLFCWQTFCFFDHGELAMVIYTSKEVAIIKAKYIIVHCLPWFVWNLMCYDFIFCHACWNSIHVEHPFMVSLMSSFILSQNRQSHVNALWFFYSHMVAGELLLCPGLWLWWYYD